MGCGPVAGEFELKDCQERDQAERELAEIQIITGYLPEQMSGEEMKAAVTNVISALEASGLKDMGRVMGSLKEKYAGQMDFSKASVLAKNLLS